MSKKKLNTKIYRDFKNYRFLTKMQTHHPCQYNAYFCDGKSKNAVWNLFLRRTQAKTALQNFFYT
jgi:hypothetical protein